MDSVANDAAFSGLTGEDAPTRLREITSFGANPGNLGMRLLVPEGASRPRALVVALHGCTQTAAAFDLGSGWSALAARHDFMLVLPEQRPANNRQTCFSWFQPDDTRRGAGEVESIRQMIGAAIAEHGADPRRVFICGLSAGGAMANAMLATYPELFAAGAMVAGIPYGAATGISTGFDCMVSGRTREPRVWGDLVRAASPHAGPWPSVAIWQGTADKVVNPINAGELVKQWTNVHGLGAEVPREDQIGAVTRRVWRGASKRAQVTEYSVPGLGHGMPVAEMAPRAPFFLPAGLSAAERMARDWDLIREPGMRGLLAALGLAR